MSEILNELKADFDRQLKKIDFKSYDPYSRPFMNALFIGQMFMCVKTLEEDDVEEELDGARKYFEMFKKTGDTTYKDMAGDELRHAGNLIKMHLAKSTDEKHKEMLNEREKERQELLRVVSDKTNER